MGKRLKQFFSLFLTLMLLLSMIPNVYATDGASAETQSTEASIPKEATEAPAQTTESEETDTVSADMALMSASTDDYAVMSIASTQRNILLFDYSDNGDYTSRLNSQVSINYKVNGTGSTKTAYLKNIGWHFARYNNVPYPDHTLYCIEPYRDFGASTSGNSVDRGVTLTGSGTTTGSTAWYALSEARRNAIGMILLYSDQLWDDSISVTTTRRDANPNVPLRVATQFLIYEIAMGLRNPDTFVLNSTNECGTSGDILYNAGTAAISNFAPNYNTLVDLIQGALVRPSFTSASSSTAPTITLTGDETSVTDTNRVLANWNFADGNGAEFYKSGNTLYIYQTGNISSSTVYKATQSVPSPANTTYNLWYMQGGTYQTTISLYSPSTGTLNAYFKLDPPALADLAIKKKTEDNANLSGWQFNLYNNSSCTSLHSGPYTTDANGNISISGFSGGTTVYVKEIGHKDSAINTQYVCASTNPQKVTLVAGQTSTVTFQNNLSTGGVKLVKNTSDGKNTSGWQIGLYYDQACTSPIAGSPFTTGADGSITISGLQPQTLYAKEVDINDPYWRCDTEVKTVTITTGSTATVTFYNEYLGRIQFKKTTNTGNHLGGWTFVVRDANSDVVGEYTVDDSGVSYSDYLPAGSYTVYEKQVDDAFWQGHLMWHDVTVVGGETVVDEWLNKELGLGWFLKETPDGKNLEGWVITIYGDEACTQELHTTTTNEEGRCGYYLEPGIYWVRETGDSYGRFDDESWLIDQNVYRLEIKPHEETTITFTNAQRGKLLIKKVMPDGGSVAGWVFDVHRVSDNAYLGSFTSSQDGTIDIGFVDEGDYLITEHIPDGSLYVCEGENPKKVTVSPGETAEVTFSNVMRPGEISILKVDTQGNPLAGAHFLLEWSEDGDAWAPVSYTSSLLVANGTCNSADLKDGILVSGEDGVVKFTGLLPDCYYRLTEVKAPSGYQLLSEFAYDGKLNEESENKITLKVVNAPVYKLPQTGSRSPIIMIASLGVALAGCAGALIFLRKRRK